MKYDKKVYEVSQVLSANMKKSDNISDKEIRTLQREFLKEFLKRASQELNDSNSLNGILKIKFKSCFWLQSENGYLQIEKLICNEEFDLFAKEYCMYLGNMESRCDEYYTSFYEVVWDYKTYFESINNQKKIKENEINSMTLKREK